MLVCVVSGCSNRSRRNIFNQSLTFHRFPADNTLKEAWLAAIHKNDWIPSDTSCVCSEHFEEHDVNITSFSQTTIKDNAVPTILFDPLILPEEYSRHYTNVSKEEKIYDNTGNNQLLPMSAFPILNTESVDKISIENTADNEDDIANLKHKLKKSNYIVERQKKQIKLLQQTVRRHSQKITKLESNIFELKKQKSICDEEQINKNLNNYTEIINTDEFLINQKDHKENILINDEYFLDPLDDKSLDGSSLSESAVNDINDFKNVFTENEEVIETKSKREVTTLQNYIGRGLLGHTRQCSICNEKFRTLNDLKEHRASVHKGPHICKICNRVFLTWRAKVKHNRVHINENKSRICEICSKEFETSLKLTKHRYTHKVYNKITCSECGKEFTRKENLTRHMLLHKNIKRHKCKVCVEEFTRSDQLKIHMNVFHDTNAERQYCTVCKYNTAQKVNLRAHMLSKHLVKVDKDMKVIGFKTAGKSGSFKCSVCDKVLSSYQALGTHTKIHSGIKKFLCKHCGRYFNTKLGLDVHERTHTGERPFPCKLCPKKFSQRTCLTTHMLTHTGERPHQCKICPKRFTQSQHLRAHVLLHTGERKHICNICNKSFTLRDGLRYHKMTHTGETPYVCQICKRGFYIPYKLKVHMAKNHGITREELINKEESAKENEEHNVNQVLH